MPRIRIALTSERTSLECYSADNKLVWTLRVADVVLLAQYTTSEGPYVDDYFLIFVTVEDGRVFFSSVTFYADGTEEVISELAQQWRAKIDFGLVNSTEWKSRVMWPPELAGSEYFQFTEVPPKGFVERLAKILNHPTYEYAPCRTVREFIDRSRSRAPGAS